MVDWKSLLKYASGGLEMLFSNERKHTIHLPCQDESGARSTVAYLVRYLCKNVMKDERKELFVLEDTVCVSSEHLAAFRRYLPQ